MHDLTFEALNAGATLVTAGQRLARALRVEFNARMASSGQSAWPGADILPWQAWLERLWQELSETGAVDRILLTPLQELALWERIIEDWDAHGSLLAAGAAARTAQEAWQLAHAWRLAPEAQSDASDDTRVFAAWAVRYRQECERHGWLDSARLSDELLRAVRAGHVPLPARLELAGFDELTPQQQQLLEVLNAAGCAVMPCAPVVAAGRAVRVAFGIEAEEAAAMAQWVRSRLAANSAARIGVVVPELTPRRAAVVRALEDALAPAATLPGQAGRERPFNVSLGLPLADHPLVHAALAILRLGAQNRRDDRLDLLDAGALLRSPFLGAAQSEHAARAALDARLRESREPYLQLSHLIQSAGTASGPKLAEHLQTWRTALDALPRRQAPGRWAAAFAGLARALGWPGERGLSSGEFQALEAWREQLGSLSALDAVLPAVDYDTALHHLEGSTRHRLFQPQSAETAVQVLGVLEAAGLTFDHLWVMGLHDEVWPPAPGPNPLLPVRRQRERNMPRSSPERELDVARRITTRLLAAGKETVASYSLSEADRVRHASPLIAELPEATPDALLTGAVAPYRRQIHAGAALEAIDDWQAPALAPGRVAGGTAVIADQSACPFRAYARHRLAASQPDHPESGLGPADRGSLAHAALESLWADLGTQARLLALDDAARRDAVTRAAQAALTRLQRRRPFTLAARFRALEQERLEALLHEWLELERQRAPFAVAGVEARRTLRVGTLELAARVDRVDVLENGERLVIDYKTGTPRLAHWFEARPQEPQLPLYALYGLADGRGAGAVAYARVKRGDCAFLGLARAAGVPPGVTTLAESDYAEAYPSWAALEQNWRATLERLAGEFGQGHAAAVPRDDEVCRDCEQKPFCRIHELNERRGRWTLAGDSRDDAMDGGGRATHGAVAGGGGRAASGTAADEAAPEAADE